MILISMMTLLDFVQQGSFSKTYPRMPLRETQPSVTLCRDYWPFSKSIKNVQFRFQIALLAVLFTASF